MNRMNTSVERCFKLLPNGFYREVYMHYIHIMDNDGNILRSKLDKSIEGALWKRAEHDNQHSVENETFYHFPDEEAPVRLIQLKHDRNDYVYGRHL